MSPANEAVTALRRVLCALDEMQAQRQVELDTANDDLRRAEQRLLEAETAWEQGGSREEFLNAELSYLEAVRNVVRKQEAL